MIEGSDPRRSIMVEKLRSGEINEGLMMKIAACAIGKLRNIKDDDQGKAVMRCLTLT